MEILGIGPLEVFLVLILALIVLGPQGMVQVARKFGRWIRALVKSPLWKDITTAQREVSDLPRKLVRDAGLEEVKASLRQTGQDATQTIRDVTREGKRQREQGLGEGHRWLRKKCAGHGGRRGNGSVGFSA